MVEGAKINYRLFKGFNEQLEQRLYLIGQKD